MGVKSTADASGPCTRYGRRELRTTHSTLRATLAASGDGHIAGLLVLTSAHSLCSCALPRTRTQSLYREFVQTPPALGSWVIQLNRCTSQCKVPKWTSAIPNNGSCLWSFREVFTVSQPRCCLSPPCVASLDGSIVTFPTMFDRLEQAPQQRSGLRHSLSDPELSRHEGDGT